MPGSTEYPKDRIAQKSYEKGPVKQGNEPKDIAGTEKVETHRAGEGKK